MNVLPQVLNAVSMLYFIKDYRIYAISFLLTPIALLAGTTSSLSFLEVFVL